MYHRQTAKLEEFDNLVFQCQASGNEQKYMVLSAARKKRSFSKIQASFT